MKKFQVLCFLVFLTACGYDIPVSAPGVIGVIKAIDYGTIVDSDIQSASKDVPSTNADVPLPENPTPTLPPVEVTAVCTFPDIGKVCIVEGHCELGTGKIFCSIGNPEGDESCSIPNVDWTTQNWQLQSDVKELCGDNLDNNCDGQTDEVGCKCTFGDPMVLYVDADDDGFGTNVSKTFCVNEVTPYGYATQSGDCNDSDSSVHPGAVEICDGIDNNCDGVTNEGYQLLGQACGEGKCSGGVWVCDSNKVEVTCSTSNLAKKETCGDNIDNDCDGVTDNGCCPDLQTNPMITPDSEFGYYCNACTNDCKVYPNVSFDSTSFKLVVFLKDAVTEDKLFAITEYVPDSALPLGKVSTIKAGKRVGVIDLDPKTTGIWYAICDLVSVGGCQINPVQTSKYVTEFFPALADEIYLIKDQQWIDLTSKMKPGLSSNSSVHGEVVTF